MPPILKWDACAAQALFCYHQDASKHEHDTATAEAYRGDEGQDEAAAAAHFAVVGAVLHMLPQQPGILLVHADRLLNQHRLTCTGASLDADHPLHRECRVQMAVQASAMKDTAVDQRRGAPWLVLRTAGKYLMWPRQSQPRDRLEQEKPRP